MCIHIKAVNLFDHTDSHKCIDFVRNELAYAVSWSKINLQLHEKKTNKYNSARCRSC